MKTLAQIQREGKIQRICERISEGGFKFQVQRVNDDAVA
jgi:hypothetical protein